MGGDPYAGRWRCFPDLGNFKRIPRRMHFEKDRRVCLTRKQLVNL
jgi:hypothetical protein